MNYEKLAGTWLIGLSILVTGGALVVMLQDMLVLVTLLGMTVGAWVIGWMVVKLMRWEKYL